MLFPLRIPLIFCCFLSLPALANESATAVDLDKNTETNLGEEANRIVSDREVVELVPDSNLAEAINRRPDLSFRNVTIDGERATVSLDDIPADQVESADVSKAVTPDKDADLRGGGLNLRSRPTYDLKRRVIKGSVESLYKKNVNGFQNEASLTYGQSMGRWGFMGTVSSDWGLKGMDNYFQDWEREELGGDILYKLKDQSLSSMYGNETEYKVNATVDYKATEQIRLYFKGDYEYDDDENQRPRMTIRYHRGEHENITESGADVKGAVIEKYMAAYNAEGKEHSLTTGGYMDFESLKVDFQLSIHENSRHIPDYVYSKFVQRPVDLRYDLSDELATRFGVIPGGQGDLDDPAAYKFGWVSRTSIDEDQNDWLATANLTVPIGFGQVRGFFKSGLKLRGLEFDKQNIRRLSDEYNGSLSMADVLGTYTNDNLLAGRFEYGPFQSFERMRDLQDSDPDAFTLNEVRSREGSDPRTYNVTQDIYAGYSMFYMRLKQLKVIAGLRYEQTELSYLANELEVDENGENPVTKPNPGDNSYANWFPGIHGRYDLGKFSFVGSWSNTILRPNFEDVVPYRTISRESENINAGNPDLMPTLYTNYNFAVDYDLNGGKDLLSMELFYYTVEDIVYEEETILNSGPYPGYEFETLRNGPSGDVYGVSLIWTQKLDKFLGSLKGFAMNAKYTYQTSDTEYPARPGVSLPMPHRPENRFRFNLSYRGKSLYAQLELDYDQADLEGISKEGAWRDQYGSARTRLDLSGSYQVREGLRIVFEVNNLTNQLLGRDYLGDGILLRRYGYFPRNYMLGLKFDL